MGSPIFYVNIMELGKEKSIMKRYGYHRTRTKEQHLDRGIKEITTYCEQNHLELEKIFTDQQTGKNFNRPRYQVLKEHVLRPRDELIITEVDRLGRNKQETLKELQYFRDKGVPVKILELPTTLMDISKLDNTMAQWMFMRIKENAAFERCVDVVTTLILKYGSMLKRKWSLDEWIMNIQAECFWRSTASRRYQQYFKSMRRVIENAAT